MCPITFFINKSCFSQENSASFLFFIHTINDPYSMSSSHMNQDCFVMLFFF